MRKIALKSRERSGCVVRGFGRRDALGGRRDALGGSRVSPWVLLACSQPRIAAQGAVGGRCLLSNRIERAGVPYSPTGCPHEWGALVLRPPVVAEPGRRAVCRCCERCLLSNRIERAAFPTLRPD